MTSNRRYKTLVEVLYEVYRAAPARESYIYLLSREPTEQQIRDFFTALRVVESVKIKAKVNGLVVKVSIKPRRTGPLAHLVDWLIKRWLGR